MAITTWVATTGDWDDSKFSRAWDGPNIAPAVGSLSLTSSIPTLKIAYSISPAKGDVELIQSYEWNQLTATWDTVIGDWSSGPVPHVAIGTSIAPAKGDLTITGSVPAAGIIYSFPVDNADLTLTGKIPFAGLGTTISPEKGDLEVLNSHTWDNYGGTWAAATTNWNDDSFAPDAVETGQNQPDKGDLTLTGQVPIAAESIGFPIPKGDLTLTGYAPRNAGISHFRSPANADLTGLKGPAGAWDDSSDTWATISGNWQTGELTPSVGITYTFPIGEGDLIASGYSPVRVRKDPTHIANIIIS